MANTIIECEVFINYHDSTPSEEGIKISYRVKNTSMEQILQNVAYRVLMLEKGGAEVVFVSIDHIFTTEV